MRRLAAIALIAIAAGAQTPDVEFFEKRVRPLLASKCYGCHGEKVQMGGLSLSSAAGLTHAFESGVIAKSDPEKSRLYRALLYSEAVKMPPTGKLALGGDCSRTRLDRERSALPQPPSTLSKAAGGISPEDRNHWAFRPITGHRTSRAEARESDRSVHPRQAPGEGHSARAAGPETYASSARNLRPHGPASDKGRDYSVPQ